MPQWLSFAFLTFTFFFPVIDPLGNLPVFNALTQHMSIQNRHYVAKKACLLSVVLTLFFGFLGEHLFEMFHLTMDALKIVGGIIFLMMGYDMLNARISGIRTPDAHETAHNTQAEIDQIAISPLTVPLLVGPGAITTSIILMDKAYQSWQLILGFIIGVFLIFGLNLFCFLGTATLSRLIGNSGNQVILRLMGLFLMIMAVSYFFEGLTPIVRDMLQLKTE